MLGVFTHWPPERASWLHFLPGNSETLEVSWRPVLSLFLLATGDRHPNSSPAWDHREDKTDTESIGVRAHMVEGTKQEPDRAGFICLFKNRISFYVQICTYLHKMYTQGPQISVSHARSPGLPGDPGKDASLSLGPETPWISGQAGPETLAECLWVAWVKTSLLEPQPPTPENLQEEGRISDLETTPSPGGGEQPHLQHLGHLA